MLVVFHFESLSHGKPLKGFIIVQLVLDSEFICADGGDLALGLNSPDHIGQTVQLGEVFWGWSVFLLVLLILVYREGLGLFLLRLMKGVLRLLGFLQPAPR